MAAFPLDNTEYTAKALGAWCGTRTRGVFSGDTHFTVATNGDLSVTLSSGIVWLKMAEFWGVSYLLEEGYVLTSEVADGSLTRWDAVCLQLDKNQNKVEPVLKKGGYGSNPPYPNLVRDLNYDEIFVAVIRRRPGATTILDTDIVDLRLDETYCGVMRDGVTGIPTAQLQQQASANIQLILDELARVNAGSEFMLKTEYAPEATAALLDNTVTITSTYQHPQQEYPLQFIPDFNHVPGMGVIIDGAEVTLFDSDGRPVENGWNAGDFVQIQRLGTVARILSPLLNKADAGKPIEYDAVMATGVAGWAKYYKDAFGIVHITVNATREAGFSPTNAAICTLPTGYRPKRSAQYPAAFFGTDPYSQGKTIVISSTGAVTCGNLSANIGGYVFSQASFLTP